MDAAPSRFPVHAWVTTVGIDIGGTFTDVLVHSKNGHVFHKKLPSCPAPSDSFHAAFSVLLTQQPQPSTPATARRLRPTRCSKTRFRVSVCSSPLASAIFWS